MSFCSNCGSQLGEGVKFCPNCGKSLDGGQAVNQPPTPNHTQAYQQQVPPNAGQPYQQPPLFTPPYQQPYAQPYTPYMPQKNILQQLSGKVKANAIIWLVVACLQYLLGIIYIAMGLDSYDGGALVVMGIFVIIVAVINTLVSVRDFRYSREVLYRPVGIYAKFSPVGGYVGMLIYNIFFGGIIGIAGSIYAFVVRSFVVNNELQFAQIEQQFMAQAQ